MARQSNIVKRLAAPILPCHVKINLRGLRQTLSIRTYSDNIIIDDLESVCQQKFYALIWAKNKPQVLGSAFSPILDCSKTISPPKRTGLRRKLIRKEYHTQPKYQNQFLRLSQKIIPIQHFPLNLKRVAVAYKSQVRL